MATNPDFRDLFAALFDALSNYAGIPISLLSPNDLIRNKRAAGRPQDLLDLAKLEAALKEGT